MPAGLLNGLGAALAWGLTDVASALAGRRIGSLAVLVVAQLASLAFLFALALADPARLVFRPDTVVLSAALGLLSSVAYLTHFTALRIGPVAVVSPVVGAYGGMTVVLAVLLRGESLVPEQWLGTVLATLGVVLTGVVFTGGIRRARLFGPGVVLAVVSLTIWAFVSVGLAEPIRAVGWLPVILVSRLSNSATSLLVYGYASRRETARLGPLLRAALARSDGSSARDGRTDGSGIAAAALAGLVDVVGFVLFAVGIEFAPVWLVGLASSFGPAVAVIVAVGFLGERLRPIQWLGLAAIGVGMVLIGLPH
jgi:drug/metabolite transporter (DMT)-like permease